MDNEDAWEKYNRWMSMHYRRSVAESRDERRMDAMMEFMGLPAGASFHIDQRNRVHVMMPTP